LENSKNRFELTNEQIGGSSGFVKPNQVLTGMVFDGKIINIVIPIKVQLKVTETPPGTRGNRAQAGTKTAIVETGAKVNVPLFIETGDIIEVNTESGEYSRRVE
jgi:elongation factor P